MDVAPRLDCADESQATSRSRTTSGAWAIGVVALATLGLLLAACGGGSKTTATASASPSTTTTTPGSRDRSAQRQAFDQCMQSHGVNASNLRGRFGGGGRGGTGSTGPTTSFTLPPGVTQQQMQSALQACRNLLPAGGGNFQNNPAFAAYRNCLQLHGVTLGTGPGQGLNRSDPTVQAALQACAALRPTPSSTTTAPPSS